jgi:hypothetical protein
VYTWYPSDLHGWPADLAVIMSPFMYLGHIVLTSIMAEVATYRCTEDRARCHREFVFPLGHPIEMAVETMREHLGGHLVKPPWAPIPDPVDEIFNAMALQRDILTLALSIPPQVLGLPFEGQKLLAQHSTCPCPVCGGDSHVLGSYGEELLPCGYCVEGRPFVVTPSTRVLFTTNEDQKQAIITSLRAWDKLVGDPFSPEFPPKEKTLSYNQLIESRRRYR